MSVSAAGATAVSGITIGGGPGEGKSIVEATLSENMKQQAINNAPMRIPDFRVMFGIGGNVNLMG
ncbi:MAG TPA: hypothetical protein PLQ76_06485 [bacterium]|nr:hypothetical protein [bacterium]